LFKEGVQREVERPMAELDNQGDTALELAEQQAFAELQAWIPLGTRDEPTLAGVTGTLLFVVEGQGYFYVEVVRGSVTIESASREADCLVRLCATDLLRILRGQQNFITAAMQGRIQVSGDLSLVQKFHGLTRRAALERGAWQGSP
jgi:hypothetical protein